MNRRSALNPFLVWNELAWKSAEMLAASAQVIHHRTGRMATAGPMPNERDRKEFTKMGQEKIEAAVLSAQAMSWQAAALQQQLGARLFQNMLAASTDMMRLSTSMSTGAMGAAQRRIASRAAADATALSSQLAESAGRILSHGLEPVHSRATANAKRLGRLKRK